MAKTLFNVVGSLLAATLMIQTLIPSVAGYEIVDPLTGYIYVPASAPHDSEAFSPDLYIDGTEPAPSPGTPVASPEFIGLLKSCVAKLDEPCGEEIFSHMFGDSTHVSAPCCEKLLKMGMKCHVALSSIVLSTDELKARKAEGIPRSKKIWNTCVSEVGSKIGAPVSLEN
ncbi:PREDICTED: uncharacterized protein LOC104803521 [Tarenaya hassleriana]|uniref:uncharacterized protein LOC104803521 n=1 Tax=Tarenaya hassleriana TaxID=28532 RepID=UPI00053C6CF4|nr:PREDICTED: uncharacterized protein LOC104803521 [Tarenaya hassleriana]